ncbi:MAG TPA: VacJ family lipoprotein [Methylomirabilota bacterium]|nr:VacJ family lipoprotein [Methylomirabilota bacterium]
MYRFRAPSMLRSSWMLWVVGLALLTGCAAGGQGPGRLPVADQMASAPPERAADVTKWGDPDESAATVAEYDPWERFNERMFDFNLGLDRRVVKPLAKGWAKAVPEGLRVGLKNAFRNVAMPRRFVNNLFQGKVDGAVRELAGFLLNSTVGIAGLGDVARAEGVSPPDEEDAGQTLARYGIKPGPYLVLPLFPPSTVRDTVGSTIDGLLDPLGLVMPLAGSIAKRLGSQVNDRSTNLELYEDVEASVLDLYGATRNLYLQRRERAIRE